MLEKTYFGDGLVYLRVIWAKDVSELHHVTSVHCFPVKEDKVLFTINPRGIDIIGGHVENGETVEEALVREAKEEASILLKNYKLIGLIEIDNRENPKALGRGYPLKGYQAFYTSNDYDVLPFKATHECTDRVFLSKEDLKKRHHNWLGVHQKLFDKAVEKIN